MAKKLYFISTAIKIPAHLTPGHFILEFDVDAMLRQYQGQWIIDEAAQLDLNGDEAVLTFKVKPRPANTNENR